MALFWDSIQQSTSRNMHAVQTKCCLSQTRGLPWLVYIKRFWSSWFTFIAHSRMYSTYQGLLRQGYFTLSLWPNKTVSLLGILPQNPDVNALNLGIQLEQPPLPIYYDQPSKFNPISKPHTTLSRHACIRNLPPGFDLHKLVCILDKDVTTPSPTNCMAIEAPLEASLSFIPTCSFTVCWVD